MLDRQQGTLERFTVGGGTHPVWSRDGRRIAYDTPLGIYVKSVDQTGAAELVLKGGQLAFYHRAKCDRAAALGKYSAAMESELAA